MIQDIKWERITTSGPATRRLPIQGGWLYQVENKPNEWSQPVFVPDHLAFANTLKYELGKKT